MKKYLLIIFSFALLFTSCDFLDKQPDDMKTDEIVWSSRNEVLGYLANCYAVLPVHNLHQDDPWLGLADECDIPWSVYATFGINLGNWNPSTWFYTIYANLYKAIRATLRFENNVDRCHEISDAYKTRYKAEVKFLRAYYYYMLVRQYGPVVLIKEEMPNSADFGNMPRNTYDECVEYICELLDEAEKDLPWHWMDDTNELGRPTKMACKAVKAVMLNLAASPQFNGNTMYADFKNLDGTNLVSQVYSVDKWKAAAAAAKDVIDHADEGKVHLYKNNIDGDTKEAFNPYKSYVDVQLKAWNPEILWARIHSSGTEAWMIHTAPGPKNLGGVGVTMRLMDAFLMNNGKPIEDPASGYVETGWATEPAATWNPNGRDISTAAGKKGMIDDIRSCAAYGHWAGEWNMFANREPRFYASVLYNKRVIPCLPNDAAKRDYHNSPGQKDGLGRVELYYGGVSRGSGSYTFFPQTGVLTFKRNDPMADMFDRKFPQKYNCIYIRYAEILLDYIEALNEYDPTNPDIRKYWDMIRERAGVPSAFVASPEIAGNQDLQREFIIRERQIELNMEGDRYFTTRRRLIALTPDEGKDVDDRIYGDGGRVWGFNRNGGDPSKNNFAYEGFYERTAIETRVFKKEYLLFPIPQWEIDKSPALVQNPFWSSNN